MAECIGQHYCAPEFFQFFSQGAVRLGFGLDVNIFAVGDSVRKFGEDLSKRFIRVIRRIVPTVRRGRFRSIHAKSPSSDGSDNSLRNLLIARR